MSKLIGCFGLSFDNLDDDLYSFVQDYVTLFFENNLKSLDQIHDEYSLDAYISIYNFFDFTIIRTKSQRNTYSVPYINEIKSYCGEIISMGIVDNGIYFFGNYKKILENENIKEILSMIPDNNKIIIFDSFDYSYESCTGFLTWAFTNNIRLDNYLQFGNKYVDLKTGMASYSKREKHQFDSCGAYTTFPIDIYDVYFNLARIIKKKLRNISQFMIILITSIDKCAKDQSTGNKTIILRELLKIFTIENSLGLDFELLISFFNDYVSNQVKFNENKSLRNYLPFKLQIIFQIDKNNFDDIKQFLIKCAFACDDRKDFYKLIKERNLFTSDSYKNIIKKEYFDYDLGIQLSDIITNKLLIDKTFIKIICDIESKKYTIDQFFDIVRRISSDTSCDMLSVINEM